MGSQSDSPAPTYSDGITRTRLEIGSKTRKSSWNGWAPLLVMLPPRPTVKVSPELSIYPPLTYAGNYGNGNGGGDFTTWVQGNTSTAFVAFPYVPRGEVLDTYVAKVPLSLLQHRQDRYR